MGACGCERRCPAKSRDTSSSTMTMTQEVVARCAEKRNASILCTNTLALTDETARTEWSYGSPERSRGCASTAPHGASHWRCELCSGHDRRLDVHWSRGRRSSTGRRCAGDQSPYDGGRL